MKCGWSKLHKIETNCEKVNLKNRATALRFSSLSPINLYMKQVVNNA